MIENEAIGRPRRALGDLGPSFGCPPDLAGEDRHESREQILQQSPVRRPEALDLVEDPPAHRQELAPVVGQQTLGPAVLREGLLAGEVLAQPVSDDEAGEVVDDQVQAKPLLV